MRTFQHFLSYYKPYRKIFYLDLFCALMISVIDILFPLILDYLSNDFFCGVPRSFKPHFRGSRLVCS